LKRQIWDTLVLIGFDTRHAQLAVRFPESLSEHASKPLKTATPEVSDCFSRFVRHSAAGVTP
jgi:hypothetical protein